MKVTVQIASAVLVAAAMTMLAACGGAADNGAKESSAAAPGSAEPRYGGTAIVGTFAEPILLNDAYLTDESSREVTDLVFARLMRSNERLEVEPDLAESQPEVSADGTVWTYRLRAGVTFHDGVPLTADDVVFTFRIFKDPRYTGPRTNEFATMSSVEAVDDYTVRFTLSEPDARFATIVTDYGILPKHLLGNVPIAELGDYREFNEHPVGAGPFKFVSWARGQNLALEAFDDYFDGRPYLDRVMFRFVANQSAGVLLLETGELDYLRVPESEVVTVEGMPHVTLHSTPQLAYTYIGWNLRNPLFVDRRVRQALTHAVDRQAFVDTILDGHGQVADSPATPLIAWAYSDDVPKFPYDPARARALLAEAGWSPGPDGVLQKDGRRFSFTLLTNDGNVVRRDLGVIAQQYLAEVGVEVKPAQLEWGAFLARITAPNSDFDAVILGWNLDLDPNPTSLWHSREIAQGLNRSAFSNARVDELADRNTSVLDQSERGAMLKEIYRIIAEEQPYMFLYYPDQVVGVRSDVHGFVQHARSEMYSVRRWWLDR